MKIITIAVLAGAMAAAIPLHAQAPPKTAQAPSASAPPTLFELRRGLAVALGAEADKASAGQAVNATAVVLADFSKRVNAYAELRKSAEKGEARLERHTDPAKINAERQALSARVQTARPNAKVGDIFTVESRPILKRLLSPQLKGPDGAENKAAIKDDNPGPMPLKVNQPYPKGEPLSTVPPDVLKALPVLPEDVEYRFVGRHLILYDARSSLVIDYMPNAIP